MHYWLESYPLPVHVLVFEELQTNTLWELYRVARFIEFPVNFKTMWCIKQGQNSQEKYKRKKPDWMKPSNVYNPEMKRKLNKYLRLLQKGVGKRHGISNILKSYMTQ